MPELKILSSDDFVDLTIAVPNSDQKSKTLLRKLPSRPDEFKMLVRDWTTNGRSMTNFGCVAPIIVAMFGVCAMRLGDLKQKATAVSNKIFTGGKTIWDLIIEGKGRELKNGLESDQNFKDMLRLFFEVKSKELETLKENLLHLIGKITVSEEAIRIAKVIKELTNKQESSKAQFSKIPDEKEEQFLEEYLYNRNDSGELTPLPTDIGQRSVKDCSLLSVLITLAAKKPEFIKKTLIKLKSSEITVLLYNYTRVITKPGQTIFTPSEKPYEYKMSKDEIDLFIKENGNRHKAKWVYAVEYAFAKLLQQFHATAEYKAKPYLLDLLTNISSASVITALTGKTAKTKRMNSYEKRKQGKDQAELPQKFPAKSEYSEYCNKIRQKILKHLGKSKGYPGLLTASFASEIESSNSRSKLVYSYLKTNPKKFLIEDADVQNILWRGHDWGALYFMQMIEYGTPLLDSQFYKEIILPNLLPFLLSKIKENAPAFRPFTTIYQTCEKDSTRFLKHPELPELFKLSDDQPWQQEWKSDPVYKQSYDDFRELTTIKDPTESNYFDRMLKERIAPLLVKDKKWITKHDDIIRSSAIQRTERKGIVANHSYAVLDCFEDKNTKYWYVTLQNPWDWTRTEARINYSKSHRPDLQKLSFPPEFEIKTMFNMELADFCKYLYNLSYDKLKK